MDTAGAADIDPLDKALGFLMHIVDTATDLGVRAAAAAQAITLLEGPPPSKRA